MLFGDGTWRAVEVIGWWTDDHGRRIVQVEWRAEHSTWNDSFAVEPGKLRDE
jgi:hypothetical protein